MSPRGLICFNVSKAGALLVVTHLRWARHALIPLVGRRGI